MSNLQERKCRIQTQNIGEDVERMPENSQEGTKRIRIQNLADEMMQSLHGRPKRIRIKNNDENTERTTHSSQETQNPQTKNSQALDLLELAPGLGGQWQDIGSRIFLEATQMFQNIEDAMHYFRQFLFKMFRGFVGGTYKNGLQNFLEASQMFQNAEKIMHCCCQSLSKTFYDFVRDTYNGGNCTDLTQNLEKDAKIVTELTREKKDQLRTQNSKDDEQEVEMREENKAQSLVPAYNRVLKVPCFMRASERMAENSHVASHQNRDNEIVSETQTIMEDEEKKLMIKGETMDLSLKQNLEKDAKKAKEITREKKDQLWTQNSNNDEQEVEMREENKTQSQSRKLEERELLKVAKRLGKDWWQVGIFLGLKNREVEILKCDHPNDVVAQSFQMLYKWLESCDQLKCPINMLKEALDDAECFTALKYLQ